MAYIGTKACHDPFQPSPWYTDAWDPTWPAAAPRPPSYNVSMATLASHHPTISSRPPFSNSTATCECNRAMLPRCVVPPCSCRADRSAAGMSCSFRPRIRGFKGHAWAWCGCTLGIDTYFKDRWRTLMSVDDIISSVHQLVDDLGQTNTTYFM